MPISYPPTPVRSFSILQTEKPEARSQKPEARRQKAEARRQKLEGRSRKPEAIRQKAGIFCRAHSGFWLLASGFLPFYQLVIRIKNRVTPPVIAPKAAPFLPAVRAPIAVAIPAVAPTINASRFQERRLPPPHRTSCTFILIHPFWRFFQVGLSTRHAAKTRRKRSGF